MKETRTTCPYCGTGCGLLATPDGALRGDPEHPANFGRLCSKGAALGETLGLEGRLLRPRIGGRDAGWDAALDLVAGRFGAALREHGPDSVAFYVSGQILTEDYYVANKLMKGFIGSANIDTNSRLCMASSVAGHRRAFGSDTVPGSYEDLDRADLVVLVGSNLAWCHPVLFQRLEAAKAARPGMKIVAVDPRQSATASAADLHLPIRPDGDIALFNGLLAEIAARDALDAEFTQAHVSGMAAALQAARAGDARASGLGDDELSRFYDLWIGTPRVVTVYSQGVNQSLRGSDKVNAILNCHLATGRIGRPGCGPFSVTGQPNAMGGREVGGLANMLACHLDIENAAHRKTVRDHWQSPTICTRPGLKAVQMFEACARGEIKALWIIGTNPAMSLPGSDAAARAIANVPFVVVSDVTETDTTALADVLLPATAWGEKTGTVTNSERCISLQRAFLPAPGEARPDWWMICEVAARMGWGAAFGYSGPAAIFREYAALSGRAAAHGRDFDISGLAGLSDAEYAALRPRRWPVPAAGGASGRAGRDGRFFGDGRFFHPDGRARMLPIAPAPRPATAAGEFTLNTGRIRDQWHSMTRSGKSPRLSGHRPEPFVEIHPRDGAEAGVEDGALVELSAQGARAVLRAVHAPEMARGSLFAPMHWSRANSAAGRVNALVPARCDPLSGQPALKSAPVSLRPCRPLWHGFAASRAAMSVAGDWLYGAVARTETGWRFDLAAESVPADWERTARAILNLPAGVASMLSDAARNRVRIAIHEEGVLTGLFFAAPYPLAVDRAHVVRQIGAAQPAARAMLGLPGAERPDPGPTVCACFNVGRNTLRRAIREGATTLSALSRETRAGGNCGACRPELRALLAGNETQMAAE